MLQKVRVASEAERDELREERKWAALWSYRAHPPTVDGQVIPFENWVAQFGLGNEVVREGRTLSDEDIKRAFSRGIRKMAVLPPGMKIKKG